MDDDNDVEAGATEGSAPPTRAPHAGGGVAERAIRTLKEQLLWVRHFNTVEELRLALVEFAALQCDLAEGAACAQDA